MEGKRERDEKRLDEEESKKEGGEQVDRWLDVRDYRSRCIEETNERDHSTRWDGERKKELGLSYPHRARVRSRK